MPSQLVNTAAPQRLAKLSGESRVYAMDFTNLLAANETISSVGTVTQSSSGTALTLGPTAISGPQVQFRISGGDSGKIYKLTVPITTSLGNDLDGTGYLIVQD